MPKSELIESVGKYIDKYYIPDNDDIRIDKEMKSIFQKITDFRKRKAENRNKTTAVIRKAIPRKPPLWEISSITSSKRTPTRPAGIVATTKRYTYFCKGFLMRGTISFHKTTTTATKVAICKAISNVRPNVSPSRPKIFLKNIR